MKGSDSTQGRRRGNALIAGLLLLVGVGAVLSTPPILFVNVTVKGTAQAAVVGATPRNVTFVDENGASYVAPVGSDGTYSISLMNGHTFSVYLGYAANSASGGINCTAGTLNLNAFGWTQEFDVSC